MAKVKFTDEQIKESIEILKKILVFNENKPYLKLYFIRINSDFVKVFMVDTKGDLLNVTDDIAAVCGKSYYYHIYQKYEHVMRLTYDNEFMVLRKLENAFGLKEHYLLATKIGI